MSKYVIDSTTLVSIGDAVREKEGTSEPILVSDLATRISAIETGGGGGDIPEEAFNIKGVACTYRFSHNAWNWFINQYGSKIKMENTLNADYMFMNSSQLENIPFNINLGGSIVSATGIFDGCGGLKSIPKITGKINGVSRMFGNCYNLRELPEEAVGEIDWSYVDSLNSAYGGGSKANLFTGCFSLRSYPNSFLEHGNPMAAYSYSIYYQLFNACASLDEVVDLPILHRNATWTSNAFNATFTDCYRLKRITFETNEDGSPIKIDTWSKQAIDLKDVGRVRLYDNRILNYNSGITNDKQVIDDSGYAALKNDPDWWTKLANYSRYNHDSAVETINTLPDLSGGKGGNTITFTGAAGALTDGGAINTLTEEEIAVATAKGWTVTLV